jgi:hypothetical protein
LYEFRNHVFGPLSLNLVSRQPTLVQDASQQIALAFLLHGNDGFIFA